ncbi:MAG: Rieske 2Fe-2S domain-containing protein [Chloroflexota bacterium]
MADFERVASTGEIPPGEMKIVEVNGEEVVIANVDGEYFCFNNACSHKQGPLGEGLLLEGGIVECPFHGGQFSVRTGEAVQAPPKEPVATYPLQVNGDDISVAVEA